MIAKDAFVIETQRIPGNVVRSEEPDGCCVVSRTRDGFVGRLSDEHGRDGVLSGISGGI
jgi:hypothetical protein